MEAQGAVLDVQLLHDLPGAQPGHIAVKDAALGLCQVGDALQKGLEGIGDGFVAAHVRQPGKLCLHLLALHLQLVHPPSGLPPVLLKLPECRREDVLVEVHAAEHHKKEDEQADQQHLQVAGKDQPAVVRHGDADGQPVGLVLAQAAKLRDACIGAVGADQLGQAAAHAAQHQHVPGGVEVAAGGAAAEGGAGIQPAVCRGKQADQVVKAGGLGKVLLEKALADLKAAQPVHGAVAAPQGQQKQLHLLRGAGEAEPLRQRISLVQRGAAWGHPAVVVRELVGLEFHAPFAVGHHAVGLANIGVAAVEQPAAGRATAAGNSWSSGGYSHGAGQKSASKFPLFGCAAGSGIVTQQLPGLLSQSFQRFAVGKALGVVLLALAQAWPVWWVTACTAMFPSSS